MKKTKELRRHPVTVMLNDEELRELESACVPEGKSAFVRQAIRRYIALVSKRRKGQATFAANLIRQNEDGLRGKFSGGGYWEDE